MPRPILPQVVTANRLVDGVVVFRTAAGGWSRRFTDAAVRVDPAEAAADLEAAQRDTARQIIVEPYLIEVDTSAGAPRPALLRETIRAYGPTIAFAPDLAA